MFNYKKIFFLIFPTLLACNPIPHQPGVDRSWARKVAFQHSTTLSEYSSCHAQARPQNFTNSYINLSSANHFASTMARTAANAIHLNTQQVVLAASGMVTT